MASKNIDLTTYSAADPIAGDFGDHYNSGILTKLNGADVNVSSRFGVGGYSSSQILTSVGTYGRKQSAGVIVGANTPDNFIVAPAVYVTSTGDSYFLRMWDIADTASGADNRIFKVVGGVSTNLAWMGGVVINVGDEAWIVVFDDGAGNTTIEFRLNPTTFDVDGHPTDGLVNTYTDSTTPLTNGQAGLVGFNNSTTAEAFASYFKSGGFTSAVAGASITASDATAARGQTNYNFTLSGGDATPGTATLSDGTNTAPITITTYNPNGVCTATIPSDIAIMYDTTAVLTFTDATSGTPTANVDFQPEAGFDYIDVTDVTNVGTSASILLGYTGAAPTVNMQVLFSPLTNVTSKAFDVLADTSWTNTPVVTQTETVQIQAISTDGSQGSVQTFTLNVGGGGSYLGIRGNKILTFGKLGIR